MRGGRIRWLASTLAILLVVAGTSPGSSRSASASHSPAQRGEVALTPAGVGLDSGILRARSDSATSRVFEPRSAKQRWPLAEAVLGSVVLVGRGVALALDRDLHHPPVQRTLVQRARPRGPPSPQLIFA